MPKFPPVDASPSPDGLTSPSLFVATLFEDEAAATRAARLMSRILQMAGHGEPVQEYACGLHLFDHPDGPAAAARRVGAADVLVVATHHDSPAVERVADWLTYWLAPFRKKPAALVAVTIERSEAPAILSCNQERLSSIAARLNMKFFSTRIPSAVEFIEDISPASEENR